MTRVRLLNLSRPLETPITARYCQSFLCKLRGLTFRRDLPEDQGLLLVQARENRLDSSIHMLGVWMDLAIVWINSEEEVVDVALAKRWRGAYLPKRPARYVLEICAHRIDDFIVGDRVKIESV